MTNAPQATVGTVYLDSPVFITAIAGSDSVPEDKRDELRELLTQIDAGAITAVISTFVIAEVRQFSRSGRSVSFDPTEADRVREMFQRGRLILRPVTERIAFRAADLGNEFPALMPADCVHIATAEQYGVDALFTRDGDVTVGRRRPQHMLGYDAKINGLRIVPPFISQGPLFDHLKLFPPS